MNEVIGIIPRAYRRRGAWVACSLLLRAGLNFLGLAMLLPVLTLVLDPRSLEGSGMLARVYTALGFASPQHFALAVCGAVVAVIVLKCLAGLWLARVERNYIYDLYRTLSRRLYISYHDRGLPFVKSSNSAVLARNVNVVCLAFTAGVLRPAAAIAAEAMLLVLLFGALMWYAPVAALLAVGVFLPSIWLYYGLVRKRIDRYGEQENKAQREKARLVAETFRGYADIEINGAFPMMLRSFDRAMDEVIRTRKRETAIGLLPQALTEIGLAVGMALLVALSLGAGDGRAQLLFGVFAVAALRLMPSVRNIMTGWTAIKYNRYTIGILRDAADEGADAGKQPSYANAATTGMQPHSGMDATAGGQPELGNTATSSGMRPGTEYTVTACVQPHSGTDATAGGQPAAENAATAANSRDGSTPWAEPGNDACAANPASGNDTFPEAEPNDCPSRDKIPSDREIPDGGGTPEGGIIPEGRKTRHEIETTGRKSPLPGSPCDIIPGNRPAGTSLAPEKLPFCREIAVRDLAFRFADDGRTLFHGLTLTIRKGERIGIRGASGAGKTTFFNLLLGLYEPTGGCIAIDGTPLTATNRRAWQNRIGYVSQNLFIADGSFAANVALGVPTGEIDRDRVVRALEAARLGEFVAGLAKGIDTHVGECGCRLSGGQRQRIGIARALYRQADVLFFDEATSALDSRTEEDINRSIAHLAAQNAGLTLLVIAHRESSLEYCDRIITIGE